MLTFQQCLDKIKNAKPDLYPIWYIEVDGNFYFNMLKRGVDSFESMSNIFMINPKNGKISGSIPVMWIYGNPKLYDKLKNPNKISGIDQAIIKHSVELDGEGYFIRMTGDSLLHYGISGQKWGVRRFQNEDRSLTPEGRERYGVGSSAKKEQKAKDKEKNAEYLKKADDIYNKNVAKHNPDEDEKKEYRLAANKEAWLDYISEPTEYDTELRSETKRKDAIKKVALHTLYTAISPYNAIYLISDGIQTLQGRHREKAYMEYREKHSEFDTKTGLYKKTKDSYDEKSDLAAVNPRYVDMNSNSKNNCMLCTTTYEMRQRGYDVTTQFDSRGYTFGDVKRWFPKAKLKRNSRFDSDGKVIPQYKYIENTISNLLKQGNGARGNIMVSWSNGGAHSMFYEVKNGKVIIKCAQSNETFKPEQILSLTDASCYARLDNVSPDIEMIKRECCR